MSAIVLDECLYYLNEAERYLSLYNEIDPFEEIFEAYKPETQLKVEQNAKAKTGVMGSLTKACQAVMKMIKNIMDSISNFFAKRNLDEEQRKAYNAFKAACAKDPELKNKKITVKDFNKINNDYNKILKEAEAADREMAKGRMIDTDKIISKITNFCSDVGKGVMVSVGAEAALNMASSSREIAKDMYKSLKEDEDLEKQLIEAIGKKETERFEKQMKSLGKRVSLHRMVMKMKGTYSKSVEDAIDKTFNSVFDLVDNVKNIADTTKDLDPELAVKGNALQRAAGNASYIRKNFGTLTKNGAGIAKNSDMLRRAYGNETIKSTTKDVIKTRSDITKDARGMYTQDKKAAKRQLKAAKKKQNQPLHDQSARDALMGKHDPGSLSHKVTSNYQKIK